MRGCTRDEHVLVRGWSGTGLPVLTRTECFDSSGAAEAALQQCFAELGFDSLLHPRCSIVELLATELASRPHDDKLWRDYADWAWRHRDPRGGLVELHEALEHAPSPALRQRLESEITAYEHAHFRGWRHELEAAHQRHTELGALRFRRGHLVGVSGMPRFELPERAPLAIAELELELRSSDELEQLTRVLAQPHWRGLTRCELRLETVLDDDHGAALFELLWSRLPRLRELVVRGGCGAVMFGPRSSASLRRLLRRHRGAICGVAVERLCLDLDEPSAGWSLTDTTHIAEALERSGLRELELRAPTIPETLQQWAKHSRFVAKLARCELRPRVAIRRQLGSQLGSRFGSQIGSSISIGPRPTPPQLQRNTNSDALWVWSDWLQARGDALGEFAALWASTGNDDDPDRRALLLQARTRVERELGVRDDGGVAVEWSGPLIRTLRVSERELAPKAFETRLARALAAQACASLETLTLELASPASLALLRRLAARDHADVLQRLGGLELRGDLDAELGPVLDALPSLERLTCRTSAPRLAHHRPHALRELFVRIPGTLSPRACARVFAASGRARLPELRKLTIEIEPRFPTAFVGGRTLGRGPALPFERLDLPAGAHVVLLGRLRQVDIEAMLRWLRDAQVERIDIVDPLPATVEHLLATRVHRHPRMRLSEPLPDIASRLRVRPSHSMQMRASARRSTSV